MALEWLQHTRFEQEHQDNERDGPREDLVGLHEIGRLPQTITNAVRRPDRLRHERDAPAKTEREPRAGEEMRQDGRQEDLAHDLRLRHAKTAREFDMAAVNSQRALPYVRQDQRHCRHEHNEDGGRVRDAEPDDGEHRPYRGRHRVHDRQQGLEKMRHARVRTERNTQRRTNQGRQQKPSHYAIQRDAEVIEERAALYESDKRVRHSQRAGQYELRHAQRREPPCREQQDDKHHALRNG